MQPVSAQPTSVTVICVVAADGKAEQHGFEEVICREAVDQLASGSGVPVEQAEALPEAANAAWVRFNVSVVSTQALRASVDWQTAEGKSQSSAEFEAGVDGATLNEDTVRMLVSALLKETPFLLP